MEMVVIKAKPLAIPIEKLQPISLAAPKRKHRPTRRLLAQHILRKRSQACNPFALMQSSA